MGSLLVAVPLAAHGADGVGLQLVPQEELFDPVVRYKENTPSFATGDHISGVNNLDVFLEGHAQVRRAKGVIKGDTIHYLQVEDELIATGSVRLFQHGDLYTGPELRLRLDDSHGYFVSPTYHFGSNGSRGFADRINFIDSDRSQFVQAIYTTCPPGDYEWYLIADTMDLDEESKEGEGHNAVVYFQGVPILAAPDLGFPLSDARRSGFLPPTYSLMSTNGLELIVPYYWNIAPNRDMTIFPHLMLKRGLMLGEDFRFLEPTSSGEVRFEAIPDGETHTFRYSFSTLDLWRGSGDLAGWSAVLNLNAVSDAYYFNDFSKTFAAAATRELPRDAELTYATSNWYVTTRFLGYQTLEQTGGYIVPPYNKAPEVVFHGVKLDYGGFDFIMDTDLTRFTSAGLEAGDRLVLNPSIAYPVVGPGYFITPKVAYYATTYSLNDEPAGAPSSLTRNLPTYSVDSGVVFERNANIFGTAFLQTLEPRMYYVYRPYANQSNYPNFDSGIPDANFSQLFADNSFLGYDRLADENQLTAAVTTRLVNPDNGVEVLRAAIGQRYYLSPQLVTLPGGEPVNRGKSDFLGLISGSVTPTLTVDTGIDYSPTAGGMERSNIGMRWSPGLDREISFEYRYLRGQFDQFDTSVEWPIAGQLYGLGRINYSARDRTVIEGLAGIEYKGCCWVLRIAAQRFVTGLATQQSSVFIQLELNGFSQIGSSPFDALRRNVVGYQPIKVLPAPASPFTNYE